MAQISEVAILPLKPGADIESGELKTALDAALKYMSEAEGVQSIFYGRQVEHPDFLELSIDWDSAQSPKDFFNSPIAPAFREQISKFAAGPPKIILVNRLASAPFSGAASAKATERVLLYFDTSYPSAEFNKNFAGFKEVVERSAKGLGSIVGGWSIEEAAHEAVEGGKGQLFVAALGWESVQAHMEYREEESFKEAKKFLREGVKGIEMHHVKFTKFL